MADIPEYASNSYIDGEDTSSTFIRVPFEYYEYGEEDTYLNNGENLGTTTEPWQTMFLNEAYVMLDGYYLVQGIYNVLLSIVIYTKEDCISSMTYPNFFLINREGENLTITNLYGEKQTRTFENGDKITAWNWRKDDRIVDEVQEYRTLAQFDIALELNVTNDIDYFKAFDQVGVSSGAYSMDYYISISSLTITPEPEEEAPPIPPTPPTPPAPVDTSTNIYYQAGHLATEEDIEADESGITNPNLHRRVDLELPDPSTQDNPPHSISYGFLIIGTDSYRIKYMDYHDEESDESEIP